MSNELKKRRIIPSLRRPGLFYTKFPEGLLQLLTYVTDSVHLERIPPGYDLDILGSGQSWIDI